MVGSINSAHHSALQGFQAASDSISQASQNIASGSSPEGSQQSSLTADLVQLNTGELQAKANIKTIETADKIVGSVIDIMA